MEAVIADLALLALFALPHSVMARPGFKRRWTRLVPPALERAVYVMIACLSLLLVYRLWRPLPAVVWTVENGNARLLLNGIAASGLVLVLWAQLALAPADFLGVRQIWSRLRRRPYTPPEFRVAGPYRWVRHPTMSGFLVAFWAAPTMTAGRLLFAASMTAYILLALRWEERDLLREHGEAYVRYRERVPMLLPRRGIQRGSETVT